MRPTQRRYVIYPVDDGLPENETRNVLSGGRHVQYQVGSDAGSYQIHVLYTCAAAQLPCCLSYVVAPPCQAAGSRVSGGVPASEVIESQHILTRSRKTA